MDIISKKCSKCGEELPLDSFYKHKHGLYGRKSICKQCESKFQKKHRKEHCEKLSEKKREWRNKSAVNKEKDKAASKKWKENHKEQYNKLIRNYRRKQRLAVLDKVGRGSLKCVRCGCDNIDLLEINHINGGGAKEVKRKNQVFYGKIMRGERTIDDLNLLCRMCNVLHYLEMKHGQLPYELAWKEYNE